MAQSGRKTITIDAPVMITSNKIAVWMDEDWMHDFFDFTCSPAKLSPHIALPTISTARSAKVPS